MAITRRRLLQGLAALGVAVGGPLLTRQFWKGRATPGPEPNPQAFPGPFPYLEFDTGVVDRFETDYRRHVGRRLEPGRWPDHVRAQFLLSTDFFRFDADESRVIAYVGFYDASVTACGNPFARFD